MSHDRRTVRRLSIALTPLVLLAAIFLSAGPRRTTASSHREAPLIAKDQYVDGTDIFAFVSPDRTNSVTLLVDYIPFEFPEGGPNWYRFDDTALYNIHVDNNGDAVPDITYEFSFVTTTRNPNTFLYNVGPVTTLNDPDLNVYQTYKVMKRTPGGDTLLRGNMRTPPVNIGPKSTPNYQALARQAIYTAGAGNSATRIFAGQRDDSFFIDVGSVFDLLSLRPQAPPVGYPTGIKTGIDQLAGYNVHTLAVQVPINELLRSGANPDPVIGVWTTSSRSTTRTLSAGAESYSGPQVQVSRLGMPLVNEVVLPRALKDAFNSLKPEQDFPLFSSGTPAGELLKKSVLDPELQNLLNGLYGVPIPSRNRDDILKIFLTGIPMLNQPRNVVPAEMLRLNTSIKPGNAACTPNPDYQNGVLGGDACGFPNGRRLWDDVTDIELRVVAGAAYSLLSDNPNADTFNYNEAYDRVLDDGVSQNDRQPLGSFPYAATPHQGVDHHHNGVTHVQLPVVFDRDLPDAVRATGARDE